jgi:DNA-binding beta-propeller fold protein YncE
MRKRSTILAMLISLATLAGACGGGHDVSIDTDRPRPELLYLGSRTAITAISPRSGAIRFQEAGAVPSRDWSVLYAATNDGISTTLRTLDPITGAELASRTISGVFTVRVVSEDGAAVALAPPAPDGFDTYHPTSKDPTPLVIVRRDDPEPQVLSVPGNVEPEAFSLEGDGLFVIDFVPPLAPERYRVARLDLGAGTVGDVRSKEQELQEPMRGTARAQVMAPDGRRLYTLYTRDATATEGAEAFVHVLDLEQEQATCVDLPGDFATSPLGALAVSPSGARLYVAAPAVGALAELDTGALEVTRTASMAADPTATIARATASDTTLSVAVGARIRSFALDDLTAGDEWFATGPVIGIKPSTDGTVLYVSLADRVLALDPRTLTQRRELEVPTSDPIDHVAPALPPIPDTSYVKCAC